MFLNSIYHSQPFSLAKEILISASLWSEWNGDFLTIWFPFSLQVCKVVVAGDGGCEMDRSTPWVWLEACRPSHLWLSQARNSNVLSLPWQVKVIASDLHVSPDVQQKGKDFLGASEKRHWLAWLGSQYLQSRWRALIGSTPTTAKENHLFGCKGKIIIQKQKMLFWETTSCPLQALIFPLVQYILDCTTKSWFQSYLCSLWWAGNPLFA